MAAAMVTVAEARSRAAKFIERGQRDWAAAIAAGESVTVSLDIPLRPPTEKAVLADVSFAVGWADSWRKVSVAGSPNVRWTERRWPSVGAQSVPERVLFDSAEAIAAFAGARWLRELQRLETRARAVRLRWGGSERDTELGRAVRSESRALIEYDDDEFGTLLDVIDWLVEHPSSGRRVRELPIRGIDTKWLESHRRVVESLYIAATGLESLGLAESKSLLRLRFLDPALRPGGLEDLAAPVAQVASLSLAPSTVFVFENLETVLAMPPIAGSVVVHGSGYAASRLGAVPWIRAARVIYWGDLDSDGFHILQAIRAAVPSVTSVLMDDDAVDRFADLAVVEKRPAAGNVDLLTDDEQRVLDRLRSAGGMRLEQERIPWEYALELLVRAAATDMI